MVCSSDLEESGIAKTSKGVVTDMYKDGGSVALAPLETFSIIGALLLTSFSGETTSPGIVVPRTRSVRHGGASLLIAS